MLGVATGVAGFVLAWCWHMHSEAAETRGDSVLLVVGVIECLGVVGMFGAFVVSLFYREDSAE